MATEIPFSELTMDGNAFWQGKCVIITGASSGIGWALAEYLAARGAKTGLIARRQQRLVSLAEAITKMGGRASLAVADVSDPEAMLAAVRSLQRQLGTCDVLVANAGIYRKTNARDFNTAAANAVIATNVQGVINAFGAVLPEMVRRRGGHLVAVGSIAGMLGLPGGGAYSASKAAVRTLLESLRVDLHPLGVKVTVVCPGYVDTPIITDVERTDIKNLMTAEQAARRIARAIQRGRCEDWFPWSTWFLARLASWAPFWLYHWIMARYPEMEETTAED